MSAGSIEILREKQDREEIQEVMGVPISALAVHCSEQMILRIWSVALNNGIKIGREMAVRAERAKLQQITGLEAIAENPTAVCRKLDNCQKIQMILDKDIMGFQYAEAIREVCGKCKEFELKEGV